MVAVVVATTAAVAKAATTGGDAGGGDEGRRGTTTWTSAWTRAVRAAAEDKGIVAMKVGDQMIKMGVLDMAAEEIDKGEMDVVLGEIAREVLQGVASRGARRWTRTC